MSNEASLSLSKELFELTGWEDTDLYWIGQMAWGTKKIEYDLFRGQPDDIGDSWFDYNEKNLCYVGGVEAETILDDVDDFCPAYDLGFLIRKLPAYIRKHQYKYVFSLDVSAVDNPTTIDDMGWSCSYTRGAYLYLSEKATTPEDCCCLLLIKLIKEKVIKI